MTRWAAIAAGALALLVALLIAPAAASAGWRAAFLALGAVPIGATTLLLIARLTGAGWSAPLVPLAGLTPWLLPAFVPVVAGQALFVARPPHLALWLAWPFFAARGLAAIALWWGLSRRLRAETLSPLGAGLGLVAHGIAVTIVGTDWLLGASPGQPQSNIAMAWVAMQVLAATGAACLLRLGGEAARRDLSFLLLAGALGLAYLLYMDFLIVWYGELPPRVAWYVARTELPAVALPPLALALGLALPIGCVALVRSDGARVIAGGGALAALLLVTLWLVGLPSPWALVAGAGGAALLTGAVPRRRA